jgi:hypothetical protein
MLATIAEANITRAGIDTVSVGQIGIGPIHIGQLVLTGFELNASTTGAELRNFRVTISHHMTLDWHLHIEIPGHIIDDSGTENLGTPTFACNFGNITLPGLESLKIDIQSLTTDNVNATANALTNLKLGTAVAETIQAKNLKFPAQGFSIAGLGLGALKINGFGAPAASVDAVTIGRIHGEAFAAPDLTMNNVGLPAASIQDIMSQGIDTVAEPQGKAYHLDLGCLDLTLKIKPKAEAQIDSLTISGINASTNIGTVELHNIVAPYELLNLTLSQIGIDTIQVPTVSIA